MLPHGPDMEAFLKASNVGLGPHKLEGTLAFMFETRFAQKVSQIAAESPALQASYAEYGKVLKKHFDPTRP